MIVILYFLFNDVVLIVNLKVVQNKIIGVKFLNLKMDKFFQLRVKDYIDVRLDV